MTDYTADRIRAMAGEGYFPKEIAKQLGVNHSEVISVMRDGRGIQGFAIAERERREFHREVALRRHEFDRAWEADEPWLRREINRWWHDWGRADYEREQRGLSGDAPLFGRSLVAARK